MCGIGGICGPNWNRSQLESMLAAQQHRGPDDQGLYVNPGASVGLIHNRLSIIDLSSAGHQPMSNSDASLWLVFNGEIYNYLELREELKDYPFRTRTDSEVILAAYERWGQNCVDHFVGMFAFAIWDERQQTLFAARDRFGVKPFYYHVQPDSTLLFASEIKVLRAAGVQSQPDPHTWSTYLALGLYDHSEHTFWQDIKALPPGHALSWSGDKLLIKPWYDLRDIIELHSEDQRSVECVRDEYRALLEESVELRFRADVPVGINLSGGVDSSTLLGLVNQRKQGQADHIMAFTFITDDERYDELPWVRQMIAKTALPLVTCTLMASDVPELAHSVQYHQDEPFGGIPTLAYARLFEEARQRGVLVLLDGQGMDEQWAGYDYYQRISHTASQGGVLQGSKGRFVVPDCLQPEFRELASPLSYKPVGDDALVSHQYRDIRYTKMPRALRFNDRVSMRSSTELREPFLDHRLFQLAIRQPRAYKIAEGEQKWLLRRVANDLLPGGIVSAPKRPLQTPQREWLRDELKVWANDMIEVALTAYGSTWLDASKVREVWQRYCGGDSENSFYIWQWINLGLMSA